MKAQAVEAQLAETTMELKTLRIQKQELGKLLHQAQLGSVSPTGQVNPDDSFCLPKLGSAGYVTATVSCLQAAGFCLKMLSMPSKQMHCT